LQEAKTKLEQAITEAHVLGSRCLQWQILSLLAQLETDKERLLAINMEARDIVDYIANHITTGEQHQAFLRSTAQAGVNAADSSIVSSTK
jgi:hypothetical protein